MNVRSLPSHRFELYKGISTNLRPDEVALQHLLTGTNVDAFTQFRCLGKVPGTTKVSDTHGAAVTSLHWYKYFDLTGTEQRALLSFAADGVLRSVNTTTGALTTLQSSLTNGALRGVEMLNRMHLTGPEQRGLTTGGIKYDGTRTTNWGTLAPGQAETVHQSLDASASWNASTDVTKANSTTSIDGGGSVSVAKTGTATTEAYIDRTGLSHDFSALGQDTLFVYLHLPYGVLQKLATSGTAVQVILGTSGVVNVNNYNFSVGELVPGWNLLSMLVNTPDSTGGAGATENNVTVIRLRLVTSSSSQTFSGVLWDKVFSQANGKPSVALGAAGNPDGTYTYRVAFLTEYGLVSNGGPSSASIVATSDKVSLTAVPVSADTQVIARLIYRDQDADAVYRFVGTIDDNVTTTFTDDVADADLGSADLPLAGSDSFDSTPPGRLYASVVWLGRIIGIDADEHFRVIIGDLNNPEAARIVDQLVLEENLIALEVHGAGLLLYSADSTFLMTGDGVTAPFVVERVSTQLGANSYRMVCTIKNIHMVQHEAEVFFVLNPNDPWLINKHRLDHFRDDITASTRSDGFLVHDRSRNRVILFNKGSGATYNQLDVWQYGTSGHEEISGDGAGVDPQDVRVGGWFSLTLPTNVNPKCAAMIERTADLPECWIGGNDGYIYWLGDPSTVNHADGSSSAAISTTLKTCAVPLGSRLGGRGEPRFLAINAEASVQTDWTATVALLSDADGAAINSVSFTVTLGAGNTSVIVPVPDLGDRGEWATVQLANATTNGHLEVIKNLELFYVPRIDFRGTRSA